MPSTPTHKVLLIILDGFGLRADKDYNAIANANTPNWNHFIKTYAFGSLNASATAVGLPEGQFGNSEVGHMNIGAGRVVEQDITRIDYACENGTFYTKPEFVETLNTTRSGVLHILGLLSDGGVHSHIAHILSLIKLTQTNLAIKQVWLHIFLDGRDTPPKSALLYLKTLQDFITLFPAVKIATVSGRYYAMDRDKRYDRVELAYNAIIKAHSAFKLNAAEEAITDEYDRGITDEFIRPHVIGSFNGVHDGDSIIFANFRSDRAIQLTDAIVNVDFNGFTRTAVTLSNFVTMTDYGLINQKGINVKVAFPKVSLTNTLGEYISNLGLHQLRIAETEKYPHVTFFLNGGVKKIYPNEERILIDSPKDVATYDLKPEMSLPEVTNKLLEAIASQKYDFIITNFANADMVGHSGNLAAAIAAVEALDIALGKVVDKMLAYGGEILVVADHGNCEEMFDYVTGQMHTQHTTNLVPCLYIGRPAVILDNGALKDVAPTLLSMSGIRIPPEMTGQNLIQFVN
ncbi:MAG: 2,3-bisphosphoglycerate-independent phosphoglycerate mutase [Burkholderiales bacterium]|nr:2,3-bisphosphoglycerate-independent phosphoglycerate mutase [Burkholderiales bacterium]